MESTPFQTDPRWDEVERRLGFEVSSREREYCAAKHAKALSTGDSLATARIFGVLDDEIRLWRRFGGRFSPSPSRAAQLRNSPHRTADQRWYLWSELVANFHQERGRTDADPWEPLKLTRVFDVSASPLPSQRVEISFDSRYSLKALKDVLTELWPMLREQEWVRGRRPIQARKLQVVRFVCLETEPSWTWKARHDRWNESHPGDPYKSRQSFLSDFRKAEESLTGRKYGLAWFYDEEVRAFSYAEYEKLSAWERSRWLQADGNAVRSQIRYSCVEPHVDPTSEFNALEEARDFIDRLGRDIDVIHQHAIDELAPELGDDIEDFCAGEIEELLDREARHAGFELDASYVHGGNYPGHVEIRQIRPDPDQLGEWRVDE